MRPNCGQDFVHPPFFLLALLGFGNVRKGKQMPCKKVHTKLTGLDQLPASSPIVPLFSGPDRRRVASSFFAPLAEDCAPHDGRRTLGTHLGDKDICICHHQLNWILILFYIQNNLFMYDILSPCRGGECFFKNHQDRTDLFFISFGGWARWRGIMYFHTEQNMTKWCRTLLCNTIPTKLWIKHSY